VNFTILEGIVLLSYCFALGCYTQEAKEIFEFVKELLAQGKRRASGLSLESLYHCLNHTILFELSLPTETLAQRTAILDTLHRLTTNRSLAFGPGNYDLEFIGCLVHCLLELTSSRHQVCSPHLPSINKDFSRGVLTFCSSNWLVLYVNL